MMHQLVAALIVQGDRILLGQRSPGRAFYPNVWDVFGGHIEPGERPEQALVRELQEELDISPTQWLDLEIITDSIPSQKSMPAHDLIVHFYCITAWSGRPTNRQPEEHTAIKWFSYPEAIKLNLAHPSYPRLFAQCMPLSTGDEK